MSGDPAMGDYVPQAPINDEAKKHNEKLSGMGGLFNTVNLHVYHYAGNNPIKYVDPDGRDIVYKDGDGNIVDTEPSPRNEVHTPASDHELLENNSRNMEKHKWDIWYFYNKVRTNADWDFKNFDKKVNYRSKY